MKPQSAGADRLVIFDTTLRDGEQSPGASMNLAEKLEVAHALRDLGVDVIEAGFPIASPGDFEAVQAIARQVEGPTICGLARCNEADIDRAWQAVKDAAKPRIHTFISTSDIHIQHQLRSTRDAVGLAVANCLAGVRAGARQAEVTINGIGERAGNAALEEIVMALRTRRDVYGIRTGVNTRLLVPVSRRLSHVTGLHVQRNKAVVGQNAFAHESGIHQDGMLKDRNTYEIM